MVAADRSCGGARDGMLPRLRQRPARRRGRASGARLPRSNANEAGLLGRERRSVPRRDDGACGQRHARGRQHDDARRVCREHPLGGGLPDQLQPGEWAHRFQERLSLHLRPRLQHALSLAGVWRGRRRRAPRRPQARPDEGRRVHEGCPDQQRGLGLRLGERRKRFRRRQHLRDASAGPASLPECGHRRPQRGHRSCRQVHRRLHDD